MSEGEWKGPTRLEDYFSKEDLELLGPLMVNVRMLVIDPYTMEEDEFDSLKTDLELILKIIKNISRTKTRFAVILVVRRDSRNLTK